MKIGKTELMAKFPNLFINVDHKYTQPPISIEIPEGWTDLVLALCTFLSQQAKLADIPFSIIQIKEKFGGIRFYYNGGTEGMKAMIKLAELAINRTCEVSGEPGELCVRGGWFKTLSEKVRTENPQYEKFITTTEEQELQAERLKNVRLPK